MPEFIYDNKLYYNPVEFAMDSIGGTWKITILWRHKDQILRYGELKKALPRITNKMLTTQLSYLENKRFITTKSRCSSSSKGRTPTHGMRSKGFFHN